MIFYMNFVFIENAKEYSQNNHIITYFEKSSFHINLVAITVNQRIGVSIMVTLYWKGLSETHGIRAGFLLSN